MEQYIGKEIIIENTTGCTYNGYLNEVNEVNCVVYIDNLKSYVLIPKRIIKIENDIFKLTENINTMSAYGATSK